LFAAFHGEVFRIDRHPVMSRHPATPMMEADLLLHLARQTDLPMARVDLADLLADREAPAFEALRSSGMRAALVDVYDERSQRQAGLLLSATLNTARPLVFGSSGVEYALLGAWRSQGLIGDRPAIERLATADRMIVVSGSCSAVTETQIRTALGQGFSGIALDYEAVASGQAAEAAFVDAAERGRRVLNEGGSPILYTALGPGDAVPEAEGGATGDVSRVGQALGRLLNVLAGEFSVQRLVVAGGDTSSHALGELDICALTLRHPIPQSPGSPVCLGHRSSARQAAVEIVLKGGQIGKADYFVRLRDGNL
jgi:3-oxoisoapionate kinase